MYSLISELKYMLLVLGNNIFLEGVEEKIKF